MNNELLYEVSDGIAVITINRPERRNALSRAVREGFFEVWRRFEADAEAQVAVARCVGYGPEVRAAYNKCFDLLGGIGSLATVVIFAPETTSRASLQALLPGSVIAHSSPGASPA